MKEIYVKPTAQSIDLEIADILLASNALLMLKESVMNVSDLSHVTWDDMQ